MENNFYVGIVCHRRLILNNILRERRVLYTSDNIYYIDLKKEKEYTTNDNLNVFIDKGALIPTDINDYNVDYAYLLSKYNSNKKVRKRKKKY